MVLAVSGLIFVCATLLCGLVWGWGVRQGFPKGAYERPYTAPVGIRRKYSEGLATNVRRSCVLLRVYGLRFEI